MIPIDGGSFDLQIRAEQVHDYAAVRRINEAAFDGPAEANLIEILRQRADPVVSMVAEKDGKVLGHIMFSPVSVQGANGLVMGLAPMAVNPGQQRSGAGTRLVREGLTKCAELGAIGVVVLGHPEFYPRFGFVPASRLGIGCEYDVPDDVFMAMELRDNGLEGVSGVARYHEAFGSM